MMSHNCSFENPYLRLSMDFHIYNVHSSLANTNKVTLSEGPNIPFFGRPIQWGRSKNTIVYIHTGNHVVRQECFAIVLIIQVYST